MSAAFEAMYPGWCVGCDSRIERGDRIRFDDDRDVIHETCTADPLAGARAVCPICWLTSCDCEATA